MGFGTLSSYTVWFASSVITAANDSNMITLANDAGALKIRRPGAKPIELCSSAQPTNNTLATLSDSGNFIFQEVYSNGSTKRVIWQTFDHPRQRLLPGMKLGVNHFENVSPDITSMYDFNVVSNEDEQSFSFNYKKSKSAREWGNYWIVATQVNRPLPKQIIVTAITMTEDVKGGNSRSVGIMVTQLNLKVAFHGRIQIYITFQT